MGITSERPRHGEIRERIAHPLSVDGHRLRRSAPLMRRSAPLLRRSAPLLFRSAPLEYSDPPRNAASRRTSSKVPLSRSRRIEKSPLSYSHIRKSFVFGSVAANSQSLAMTPEASSVV